MSTKGLIIDLTTRHLNKRVIAILMAVLVSTGMVMGTELLVPRVNDNVDTDGNGDNDGNDPGMNDNNQDPLELLVSGVNVSITNRSAIFSWNTTLFSDSKVMFGLASEQLNLSITGSSYTINHELTVTNQQVVNDTVYLARIESFHPDHGLAVDDNNGSYYSFVIPSEQEEVVPLVITDVTALPSTDRAVISWLTNKATTSRVRYGTDSNYGFSASNNTCTFNHSVVIPAQGNMVANTTYFFAVESAGLQGNLVIDDNSGNGYQFTTLTVPGDEDIIPPVISDLVITTGNLTASITWTTDELATTGAEYWLEGGEVMAAGSSEPVVYHSVSLTDLQIGLYYIIISSTDQAGNTAFSNNSNFTASLVVDPVNLAFTTIDHCLTNGTVTFNTTTNLPVSLTVYSGTLVEQLIPVHVNTTYSINHAAIITGLQENAGYYFKLEATSAHGETIRSPLINLTTGNWTVIEDTVLPVISGVDIYLDNITITICWTTDELADSAVYYFIEGEEGSTAMASELVTDHFIEINDITSGNYRFNLTSTDTAGNSAHDDNGGELYFLAVDLDAPVFITGPDYQPGVTGIGIYWQTAEPANYSIYFALVGEPLALASWNASYYYSWNITLGGLVENTCYELLVTASDPAGNVINTSIVEITTLDTTPPIVSDLTVHPSETTALVTFDTDELSHAVVNYGTGYPLGLTINNSGHSLTHSLTLAGLDQLTVYYYELVITDASDNIAIYGNYSFTTTDETLPVMTVLIITAGNDTVLVEITASEETRVNTSCYDSQDTLIAFVNGSQYGVYHVITLTGLAEQQQYRLVIVLTDHTGNSQLIENNPELVFTTLDGTPPLLLNLSINPSNDSVVISWRSVEEYSYTIDYGLSTSYGLQVTGESVENQSVVTITLLAEHTCYYFTITLEDTSGNNRLFDNGSSFYSFITLDFTPPPLLELVITPTNDTVTIEWQSNENYTYQLEYGLNVDCPFSINGLLEGNFTSITLDGLLESTRYYFTVTLGDSSGNYRCYINGSVPYSFTTLDFTPPVLLELAVIPSNDSVLISWQSSENHSYVIHYGPDEGCSFSVDGQSEGNITSLTLVGLDENTEYYFTVALEDSHGNYQLHDNSSLFYRFVTGDATPPPLLELVVNPSNSSVTISWRSVENHTYTIDYGLSPDYGLVVSGDSLGNISAVIISFLEENTRYYFIITLEDISGNYHLYSNGSVPYTFITLDFTPPVLLELVVTPSNDSASIEWQSNENHSYVVHHGPDESCSFSVDGQSTGNSTVLVLTGLDENTRYYFTLVLEDTSGNQQLYINGSVPYTFLTGDATAPAFTFFDHVLVNDTVTFSWQTGENATNQVYRGTNPGALALTAVNDTLATVHSVTVTGLAEKTTYYFRFVCTDAAGNSGYYPGATSTLEITTGDWTEPAIESQELTPVFTSINVSLVLSEEASVLINYGTSPGGGLVTGSFTGQQVNITINDLEEGTDYYLSFEIEDSHGNNVIDDNGTSYYLVTTLIHRPVKLYVHADTAYPSTASGVIFIIDAREQLELDIPVTAGLVTANCSNRSWTAVAAVNNSGIATFSFDVFSNDSGLYAFTFTYSGTVESPYYSTDNISSSIPINSLLETGIEPVIISTVSDSPWITPTDTLAVNVTLECQGSPYLFWGEIGRLVIRENSGNRVVASKLVDVPEIATEHVEEFVLNDLFLAGNGIVNLTIEFSGGRDTFAPAATWLVIEVLDNEDDYVPVSTISDLVITVTSSGFVTSFSTDKAMQSRINYGLTEPFAQQTAVTGYSNYFSFTVTEMAEGVTVLFEIVLLSTGGYQLVIRNGTQPFNITTLDISPPVISEVDYWQAGTEIIITWITNEHSTSRIDYGTGVELSFYITDEVFNISHRLIITDITTATYYFKITAVDSSNNEVVDNNNGSLYQLVTDMDPPVFISGPNDGSATNDSIWLSWITDEPGSYRLYLGLSAGDLAVVASNTTLDEVRIITIDSLAENTRYYFIIEVTDAAGNQVNSSLLDTITLDWTAPFTAGRMISPDETAVLITFTTNELASSSIRYSDTVEGLPSGSVTVATVYQLAHSIEIADLEVNTEYFFEIRVEDESGNHRWDSNGSYYSFITLPDETAPAITDITVITTPTTATINWSTDEPADSRVSYGTDPALGFEVNSTGLITDHSLLLSGLYPDTGYYFDVFSTDHAGNLAVDNNSGDHYFFTTSPPIEVTLDVRANDIHANTGDTLSFTVVINASSGIITDGQVIIENLHTGQNASYSLYAEINNFNWLVSDPFTGEVFFNVTYDGRGTTAEGYGCASSELAVILNDPVIPGSDPAYLEVIPSNGQVQAGGNVTFTVKLTSDWYFALDSPAYFNLCSGNYSFVFATHVPPNDLYLEYTFDFVITVPWWFESGDHGFDVFFSGFPDWDLQSAVANVMVTVT